MCSVIPLWLCLQPAQCCTKHCQLQANICCRHSLCAEDLAGAARALLGGHRLMCAQSWTSATRRHETKLFNLAKKKSPVLALVGGLSVLLRAGSAPVAVICYLDTERGDHGWEDASAMLCPVTPYRAVPCQAMQCCATPRCAIPGMAGLQTVSVDESSSTASRRF